MKKLFCLILILAVITGCCAMAEQEVVLPNSRYVLDVPDWMEYSDPVDGDRGVEAYISKDLEMDYLSYTKEQAAEKGMKDTLKASVKYLNENGTKTELRKIQGIEMLCYRTEDEADGARCIGYVLMDGEWMIEISFWYANEDAAKEAEKIITTIRPAEQ